LRKTPKNAPHLVKKRQFCSLQPAPVSATLDLILSDPPTQSELAQVLAKLNESIVGLRR
jgi:hypothetical protein